MRVDLIADTAPFEDFLADLLEHLPKIALERRHLVVDRLQALLSADCVDLVTLPALRADVVRVSLEPSEKLRLFAAAVRAGDVDALLV